MFKYFKNLFNQQPEQIQRVTETTQPPHQAVEPHRPNIFNTPTNWEPLDSVLDTTPIPGTSLEIGTIGRVFETSQDERIEMNQRRGIKGGCGHMLFSLQEIGGTCDSCSLEVIELLNQGGITKHQAEEYTHFCTNCASYCFKCFTQRLCARHTKLFQEATGRVVPLCPNCYEELTHEGGLTKLLRFLFG